MHAFTDSGKYQQRLKQPEEIREDFLASTMLPTWRHIRRNRRGRVRSGLREEGASGTGMA
jgi:hypothetical protein